MSPACGALASGGSSRYGPRPMSTNSTTPAWPAPGSMSSPGLMRPKVTVTSARTAGPATAPVSASMPDGRSTATVTAFAALAASCAERGVRLAQPALAADAEHAVDDQVRVPDRAAAPRARRRTGRAGWRPPARSALVASASRVVRRRQAMIRPARGGQRPRAPGVHARPGLDGGHRRAPAGQPLPRVERVPAVVAGPGEYHHPRPVDPARASRAAGPRTPRRARPPPAASAPRPAPAPSAPLPPPAPW